MLHGACYLQSGVSLHDRNIRNVPGMVARKRSDRTSVKPRDRIAPKEVSDRGKTFDPGQQDASKKDQILSLFTSGITDVEELARITESRPSYVTSVLQE